MMSLSASPPARAEATCSTCVLRSFSDRSSWPNAAWVLFSARIRTSRSVLIAATELRLRLADLLVLRLEAHERDRLVDAARRDLVDVPAHLARDDELDVLARRRLG